MSKTTILKAAFETIYRSGAAKLMAPTWGGCGVIFCLHHVTPGGGLQKGFAPNTHLEITPEFLSDLILLVRSKGYELLSIADIAERLKRDNATSNRFAVFTLDDGYRDNLQHAMPVFQRHNCPFTVYVAPRIADGTCELWWRILEAVIATNDAVTVEEESIRFNTSDRSNKLLTWRKLLPIVQTMPEYEQRIWIRRLAKDHGLDVDSQCRNAAMNWDEIRAMANQPLATIGAHTLNHYSLKRLPAEDAQCEIIESGKRIEAELGQPIQHFAYPYGNKDAAGPREFQIAKSYGYATAVVTRLGPVQSEHRNHMHALPRIMVSGRYQNTHYIEALISGIPSRLSNKFQSMNVD
jgi:peptidoglycan/xylan/chitin deacetylase (PgdA/CDA1 family)